MTIPFENVIIISEECHGFISIGVARDVPSAIDFLWQNDWLSENTEIFLDQGWESVQSAYGEEWREYFKSRTLDELRDIFDGCFGFQEEKVW